MPSDVATAIAYVGAFVGLVGGGVALFNSRMAVAWKRAELANSYLKDFNSSPELTFAGRCLDWSGDKLIVPEGLRPFLADGEKTIQHDKLIFAHALRHDLQIGEFDDDPRRLPGTGDCLRDILDRCGIGKAGQNDRRVARDLACVLGDREVGQRKLGSSCGIGIKADYSPSTIDEIPRDCASHDAQPNDSNGPVHESSSRSCRPRLTGSTTRALIGDYAINNRQIASTGQARCEEGWLPLSISIGRISRAHAGRPR